ncbi:MAG: hypoxanthine-guanine phosphoribosyltransferase [Sphingobacteriia bacterium]|nr:hypoxanthine-guanine phosphoribosyltransferase [Sphingobacteriia bacterium]NCC38438.1 hypoxanthine-guanine phosphoribosyltransferase [Gammaproteobacteria bacterium]
MKLDPHHYDAVAARSECLVTADGIDAALERMAQAVTERLAGKDPLVLCVMTGAVFVSGLLLPRLSFQLRVDYIHASRYRGDTRGGELHWLYRPSAAIRGEHILVLDDVLDEGTTLRHVIDACHADGALSVHSAVLVAKDRAHECEADIVGVEVPDRYLYGYGLDYRNYFRNAPGIYAVAEADI